MTFSEWSNKRTKKQEDTAQPPVYKAQYTQLGKRAMQDTMGQASALTGGYGSSYAQNVGQQAYNEYMTGRNDVIPELYQLAYDRYRDKGDQLYKTYQSWADLEQQAADREQWEREYELAVRKQRDDYTRFHREQEYKTSQTQTGTSQPDYWAMLAYHQKLGQRTGGNDTVATTAVEPEYDNQNVSEGNIKTMQRLLGLPDTGKWTDLEHQKAGNVGADAAWEAYQQGKLQGRSRSGMSMDEWAEKTWLSDYADAPKTKDDWEKEMSYLKAELTHLRQLRSERDRLIEFQAMSTATPEYYDLKKRWEIYHNQFDNLDERIKKLEEDLWWYEREEKYKSLSENPDFDELSKKDPPFMDWTYVAVNDPTKARRWETAAFIHGVAPVYDALNYDNLHYMKDEERANYNYLYAKEGEDAAKEYLDYLQYELNKRSADFWNEGAADLTQKNAFTRTAASLLSTPVALMGGKGLTDAAWQNIRNAVTGDGKPVDYNRDAMLPAQLKSAIVDTVAQHIEDAIEQEEGESLMFGGKFLPELYRLAMDMLDSATVKGLTAAHKVAGGVASGILSDTAGTQVMLDAVERGATDEQALNEALLSVFFDMLLEESKLGTVLKYGGSFLKNLSDRYSAR